MPKCYVTILAEIYGHPLFFGSSPGFVNRTQSHPGFVNPVRSGPGFVNPIRSDPVRVLLTPGNLFLKKGTNPGHYLLSYFSAQYPKRYRKSLRCGPFEAERHKRYQNYVLKHPKGTTNTVYTVWAGRVFVWVPPGSWYRGMFVQRITSKVCVNPRWRDTWLAKYGRIETFARHCPLTVILWFWNQHHEVLPMVIYHFLLCFQC